MIVKRSFRFYSLIGWLILLIITNKAEAQTTGWVNGYIVVNNGDTLRGELYNKDWNSSPTQLLFRQPNLTGDNLYTIQQVRAFYLEPSQELFVRVTTPIDKTPYKTDKLQRSDQIIWSEETVWAQQLLKGLISLVMYRDKEGKTHYLVQKDKETWQELIRLKYLSESGQIVTVNRYKQQLGSLTFDCPSLSNRLTNLILGQNALLDFMARYNMCQTGKSGSFLTSGVKAKVEWGLLAGASISRLTITIPSSKDYFSDQPYHYTGTAVPNIGLWLNYYLLRNRQQWSLYNDLHYHGYNLSGTWLGNASQLSGQFQYRYIKLHTGFRWQLPKNLPVKPFVMLGVSNGFAFSHQQTIRQSQLNRTYEQALFGAAGLRMGRFLGEVRYERGNGISTDNIVVTSTQTLYLLLSFAL